MIRERILKIAIKLGSTNPKAANYLLKIAMPFVFDAEDPKETRPYEIVHRVQNTTGEGFWRKPENWKKLQDYSRFEIYETIKKSNPTKYRALEDPISDQGFLPQERQPSFFQGKFFAFESPTQANLFIMPQQWSLLSANGFFLVPVKAKRIWSSGSQVFFEPYL